MEKLILGKVRLLIILSLDIYEESLTRIMPMKTHQIKLLLGIQRSLFASSETLVSMPFHVYKFSVVHPLRESRSKDFNLVEL